MKINKFEDLEIWRDSLTITKELYDVTSEQRFSRDFALRDQLRRAIVSVSSNIVEGFEKSNNNEFIRYLKIAKGSSGEVKNQVYVAHAVGYIDKERLDDLLSKLNNLSSKIASLIKYLEMQRSTGKFLNKNTLTS